MNQVANRDDVPVGAAVAVIGLRTVGFDRRHRVTRSMLASWSTSLAGRGSEQAELFYAGREQLVDQVGRQRFIDREVQRSCGASYPVSSDASAGKTEPLCGRWLR